MRSLAAALALLVVVLTGCDQAEDAKDKAADKVKDTAADAGCALAKEAVDGAGSAAGHAINELTNDPQGSVKELKLVRKALDTADKAISDGDLKDAVAKVRTAVGDLLDEANKAADGKKVDQQAIDEGEAALTEAIDGVKNAC